MKRKTNRTLLDQWLAKNGPDGVSRLAIVSNVSASTIQKARATRIAPKKEVTLQRLAEAVGCELDQLFPLAVTRGKAS